MSEAEFKDLTKKRSTIKGRITHFKNYLNDFLNYKDVTQKHMKELALRLSRFEVLFNEFDTIQSRIEVLSDDCDVQLDERSEIEKQFYSLISLAQETAQLNQDQFSDADDNLSKNKANSYSCDNFNVKLPLIQLPVFDGDYSKWLEFKDTFKSLIHDNTRLSGINKLHYLRSSLQGSASVVIKSLEFSNDNYDVAWQLICERFDNKGQLITNHFQDLLSIEALPKESDNLLRNLADHITKHLRALNTLGEPTDNWDSLIVHIFAHKLDSVTLRNWEEVKNRQRSPTLQEFREFLRKRADILESLHQTSSPSRKPDTNKKLDKQQKSFVASASESGTQSVSKIKCLLCSGEHRIYACKKFLDMSPELRYTEVVRLKLCANCFRGGHFSGQCRLGPCKECGRRHHTLLHKSKPGIANNVAQVNEVSEVTNTNDPNSDANAHSVSLSSCVTSQVLLSTAVVKIVDEKTNQCHEVRALLDSGSQSSFITSSLKNRLGLLSQRVPSVNVTGINNMCFKTMERCTITLKIKQLTKKINCLTIDQISKNLPSEEVDIKSFDIPQNIQLADPTFYRPSQVELLLGADVFWDLIIVGQIKLGHNKPILNNSTFGWLVVGPTMCASYNQDKNINCNFSHEIRNQLRKFWELEELPPKLPWNQEETLCEDHFVKNTRRLNNGRFCVSLPLKGDPLDLGDSFSMSFKRLTQLERRFRRQPHVKQQYSEFIQEYKDLGHLSEIEKPEVANYLPHHPVLRDKSETTKCRVVFDASAKTASGLSLNDILMVGPTIQEDIFSILIRLRQHRFVLLGDIEKMYRQIMLDEKHRHLQMILWRNNENEPLQYLQLNTVTYGTSSAPFLSVRCLFELADSCDDELITKIIKHDFYVDDLCTGHHDPEKLKYILKSIKNTLNTAQMNLRKIKSNCTYLFNDDKMFHEQGNVEFNKECSTLGIKWNPSTDKLMINLPDSIWEGNETNKCTKRNILSFVASIFDPLGVFSVCTILLKNLLQELWSLKLQWDDDVPINIRNLWQKMFKGFHTLALFEIERYGMCDNPKHIEIHVFCDASLKAYAACIYIRSIDDNGVVSVKLLCAKAKVSPLKATTIPRLELCGALLGSRLCDKVTKALRCNINRYVYWTDSQIVLSWLKTTSPSKLKTFVSNRVSEITDLSHRGVWRYVPSALNPADLASRGLLPEELPNAKLWWNGPSFLLLDEMDWPSQAFKLAVELPEIKVTTITLKQPDTDIIDIERFSNFNKLRRTVAFMLRFIHNCKNSNNKMQGSLTVIELQKADIKLIYLAQSRSFESEINSLKKGKTINIKSKILSLNPYLDADGVMRVGGRLDNSTYDYNKKHPMIVDSRHYLTKLLFEHYHLQLMHAGPQLLLSSIREMYWPVGGRQVARQTYRKCVTCRRVKGEVAGQIMGGLPSQRITPGYPFQIVGTDYAGPFYIINKRGRGARLIKAYLCLFICFKTKAVHLELASDLSTESFILAFRRFISRRGKPLEIFSDNGRNFVGASKELGKVVTELSNSVSDNFSSEGIQFRFSPAYSPNYGGLYEAAIKSAKFHIKRIVGNIHLTAEELTTVFVQVEAILNSRPLYPMSSDPHDLSPLSPGHFLIGRPLTSLPAPDLREVKTHLLHRYAKIEQMRQHFWSRWSREYICELQQRTKWQVKKPNLEPGQLVLIKEEHSPPLKWPLGRIKQCYPGTDGCSRVADVETTKGILRRAITRLCPLLDMDNEELEAP